LQKQAFASTGRAINYRFLKDHKGWRLFVSIEQKAPEKKSKESLGSIGIDINAGHLAIAETDRFGNIIAKKSIPCSTYGKSTNARLAIIGDATKEIVSYASQREKPLVVEDLNFQKKKQALRESKAKLSRLLSSFAYHQILSHIESKAFKEGIEIYSINPAYTSIIGEVKFSKRYGLSRHHAAALVIARRKNRFSEKPPQDLENSKSAFSLPVRNHEKYVWSFYRELSKKKKAAHEVHLPTKDPQKKRDSKKASADYG
jgi:IS605 OrfB family transposase